MRLAKILLALMAVVLAGTSCAREQDLSPEEIAAIAKEAYIYGFPMVMNCKTVYDYAVDVDSPEYKGPFNQVSCVARLFTPDDKAIVTPNSDTPYCMFWMDLRSEPLVISVPEMEPERFYHVQLIDWYTHNYAYIGTRTNGNKTGKYLLAGPAWKGDTPEGITQVMRSETDLIFAIIRTQLFSPDDLDRVKEIQSSYALEPLSSFIGKDAPPDPPEIDFPEWVEGSQYSAAAFEYLDFALDRVDTHPDEVKFMTKLAKIGIGTPGELSLSDLEPAVAEALEEGVQEGLEEIQAYVKMVMSDPIGSSKNFGTREFLDKSATDLNQPNVYILRAGAALLGLYGNSGEEAVYPGYFHDKDGNPFNAAQQNYAMTFEAGNLPPVRAFWSLSMYDGHTQLFIHNPLDRYLLNSSMVDEFAKEEDGSIVFYIQKDSPGEEKEANWLPAPDGPFYLVLRMYLPEDDIFEGKWTPPTLDEAK